MSHILQSFAAEYDSYSASCYLLEMFKRACLKSNLRYERPCRKNWARKDGFLRSWYFFWIREKSVTIKSEKILIQKLIFASEGVRSDPKEEKYHVFHFFVCFFYTVLFFNRCINLNFYTGALINMLIALIQLTINKSLIAFQMRGHNAFCHIQIYY